MRSIMIPLICLTMLTSSAQATSGYTLSEDYVMASAAGLSGPQRVACDEDVNVNGVCFTLRGDEVNVDIVIQDKVAERLSVGYRFLDANGIVITFASFCGLNQHLSVPHGAVQLELRFSGGPSLCATGTGVGGTVTATFT